MLFTSPLFLLRRVSLLGLVALTALRDTHAAAPREQGLPLIRAFYPRDYEGHNQTWSMVQDRAGVLYVGNRDCVLSYDGVRWTRIPTADGLFMQGLAIDADDRIWVSGANELGYLDPDGKGGRVYTSLREKLPDAARALGTFFDIITLPHGIYFISPSGYVRWHDGRFTHASGGRMMGFPVRGEFVLHERGQPLRAFDGENWRTVTDAEPTKNWITLVRAQPDGTWLLGTLTDGFWRLRDGHVERWTTEVDERLRTHRISWATQLADGTLAISQRPNGVLLLGPDGRLRQHLDAGHGLPGPLSSRFFQDRQGNLWISLDHGLVRLTWPPRLTTFSRVNGLGAGVVKALARHAGRLYVGTSEGLFVLQPASPGPVPTHARFVPVPEFGQNIWSLHAAHDRLLVATNYDVRAIDARGAVEPVGPPLSIVCAAFLRASPDRVLIGTTEDARLFERRENTWHETLRLPDVDGEVRAMTETADGSVWIAVSTRGFYRVTGLSGGAGPAPGSRLRVEHFPGGHGLASERLPGLPTLIATSDGDARFLDDGRVYRFAADAARFEPVADLAGPLAVEGVKVPTLANGHAGRLWFRTFRSDADAGPWQGRQIWTLAPDGTRAALPFAVSEAIGDNPIFFEEPATDGTGTVLWLGGVEGLIRAELPAAFAQPVKFSAVIRSVSDQHGRPLALTAESPRFPYDQRSLSLALASDRLDDQAQRYQVRVDDEPWSRPASLADISLPRLPPGQRQVTVRVRDADGRDSAPARLAFTILPPWWATWWAFGLYAAGLGAVTLGVARWRLRAVRRRNEELERLIATRTTELRSREQQLVEARDAAESANRAKSVFLASMSHELRTPLNAILGYAQILRRAPAMSPDACRQLETIHASGDHLLTMINDVLDLAKIEAGTVELRPQPLPLARLLAHLTEVFEPRAAQKGIAFSLHCETPLPEVVLVDETRLRQVLYNLLGNALKFTERGHVCLRLSDGERGVCFTVEDTGIGIAAAEQARIFDLFHQAASTSAFASQGAGLGLAISQRLVRLMGGEIAVESVPAQGSRFSFTLPLAAAAMQPPPRAAAVPLGYRGPRRRVLIVDDEPVNRDVLRSLLAPLGFELAEAQSGEAAVAACSAEVRPDLVLLDLRLQGLDGLSAARQIRALPGGRAVRIIAISASVFPVDRSEAIAAGCDDFEPKPFRVESLLATIARALALEWQYPAAPAGSRNPVLPALLPDTWPLPPHAVLVRLEEQADFGDLTALRATLAAARSTAPEAGAFLDALEVHAASARLAPLREWIAAALARSAPPDPPSA